MGFVAIDDVQTSTTPARGFIPLEGVASSPGFTPLPEEPGFLDHLGKAMGGSLMSGVTPESAAAIMPAEPAARVGLGMIKTWQDAKKLALEDPLGMTGNDADLETREKLAQVNRDRELTQGILGEISAQDPTGFAGLVGSALESLGVSSAGLVAVAAGAGIPLAMGVGLLANMAAETAGEYGERRDLGQEELGALGGGLRHGAVSTALEAAPMGSALKYVKGVNKELGKTLLKVGVGEAAQEGLTQVYKDIATNVEDLTDYSAEAILDRTLEAAATGALMVPMMGAAGSVVRRGQQYGAAKKTLAQEKALLDTVHQTLVDEGVFPPGGTTDARGQMDRIIQDIRTQQSNPLLANIQASQMSGALAGLPAEPGGTAIGDALTRNMKLHGRRTGQSLAETQLEDADLGGITEEVQARRNDYLLAGFAGNDVPLNQRVVYYQTNPNAVGLRTEQIKELPDGSVTVLGGSLMSVNALMPGMMPELVGEAVTAFQRITGVQNPIIVTMEQLDDGKSGNYSQIPLGNGRYAHVINPRELPSAKFEHGGNRTTQLEFLGTLSHEFGHAVKEELLQRSVETAFQKTGLSSDDARSQYRALSDSVRSFAVTPEQIESLRAAAPVEAALIERWNNIQTRAREGTISARDLVKALYGPRKLGLSFENKATTPNIFNWVEREARAIGITRSIEHMSAQDVMAAVKAKTQKDASGVVSYVTDAKGNIVADMDYVLSFDEFMAEQFSRAAHDKNYLKGTRLATWFQSALEALRNFFGGLKDQGFVKPDETFERWLDKQTALAKKKRRSAKWGQVKLSRAMQKLQKEQAKQLMEEREAIRLAGELELVAETTGETEEPPLPEEEVAAIPETRSEQLSHQIQALLDEGIIEPNSPKYKVLYGKWVKQQYDELEEKIWDLRGGSWDQGNPTSKLISRLPEKETLKRVTVEGFSRQADLRKPDLRALEAVLKAYPEGNVPRAAVISAVLDRNVPLTKKVTKAFSDSRLRESGLAIPFSQNPNYIRPQTNTHIWQAPFTVGSDNHFNDPAYVAHTRVIDTQTIRTILEVQSDFFQNQSKKGLKYKRKNAWVYAVSRASDVERLAENLRQAQTPQEQERWTRALALAQQRSQEADASLQRFDRLLAGQPISPEHERVVESMQRQDWWKRVLKEEITDAALAGKLELRVADADTIARLEDWEQDEVTGGYGEMQGAYDRYAKLIPRYLQKEYGAVLVEEEFQADTPEARAGKAPNRFWAFNIPESAKTLMLWDQGNPATPTYPQITADYLAGLSLEEMRSPEMVSQAVEAWKNLGFESPFFKRWYGASQLKEAFSNDPLVVFHGSGAVVEYFDITLATQEKVFFFSGNPLNANFYGKQIWRNTPFFKNIADSRKAQDLRGQIARLGAMLDAHAKGQPLYAPNGVQINPDIPQIRGEFTRLRGELGELRKTAEALPAGGVTTGYYLRMENLLEIDFQNADWVHGAYDELIRQARELGHDGIVVKNVYDPALDTVYMVFNPEQIKDAYRQKGPFEESDRVQWDQGNPRQMSLKQIADVIKKISPETALNGAMNAWHRTMDALVQLQQRAAVPLPNGSLDIPMQAMLKDLMRGEAKKNTLQQPGEMLTKALQKRSLAEQEQIYGFLEAEWKSGRSSFTLQGWTGDQDMPGRELIWGELEDGGLEINAAVGKMVRHWEYGLKPETVKMLAAHGIDVTTEQGAELTQLILQYKAIILAQFTELENVLTKKIVHRYQANTVMAATQVENLYQTMQKIRLNPFFPQGRYGDYSISIMQKKANPKRGERKFKTVRVEYFETKAEMQTALAKWQTQVRASKGGMKLSWKQAQDYRGIPLTLPRNLLEQLEATQLFTQDQLETMSEMMLPVGHEKLAVKYGKTNDLTAGGERDLVRNYSNFIWHNANFIWKLEFRSEFTKAINAHNALLRRAQQDPTPAGLAQADALQRNADIMRRVKEYVLYPPYELQSLRTAATLVFLAYNAKTALMNFSTMLNSYAAITAEYGETAGNKLFAKGLYEASRIFALPKSTKTAHIQSSALTPENSLLAWMYNKAVTEGVLDQSYAYFLAGQANGAAMMRGIRRTPLGRLSQVAAEVGMYPFRMVEKANRLATLVMFFEAERSRGMSPEVSYGAAVQRMNLLQNAYDAGNRPELFRGKKAILTMFASYTQFMTWNMMGGYGKALKADLRARELGKANHMFGEHAYTMKLWLIYLVLGGMLAPPFAENLVEVLMWVYRKIYGLNLRLELRQFIKELGGDPDLIMHGMLGNVAGMDLSGSFSLGRTLPGIDMLNRDWKNYQEWLGSLAVKGAGAFGGFTEDIVKFLEAAASAVGGTARPGEVLKELPGAAGAVGKAYDAWVLQRLQPTYGVLDKTGARVVEDPPGSGNFRDLTNWEMIGMALGGNPAVLSRSREMNFMETGEQMYWRTKIGVLLDHRWKAINTRDDVMLGIAEKDIQKFNESLPKGYESLRITGKMKADSIKTHRRATQDRERGKVQKKFRDPQSEISAGFAR